MTIFGKILLHGKNHNLFHLFRVHGEAILLRRKIARYKRTGNADLFFPKVIQIQTQSYCNARCIFCPYPETHRKLPQGIMSEDLFKKIADEASARRDFRSLIFILQNEPLIDERLPEFIRYFKQTATKASSSVVTNGKLLTPDLVARMEDLGVDRLTVSINSMDEKNYRTISPGIDFQRLMNTVHEITAKRRKKLTVVLSFVKNIHNSEEMDGIVRYWQSRGVLTKIMPVLNRAGSLSNYGELRSPPVPVKRSTVTSNGSVPPLCTTPFRAINILFNGDVPICQEDWNRSLIVGNVVDSSIQEVFQGKIFRDIREKIISGRYDELEPCRHCSQIGLT